MSFLKFRTVGVVLLLLGTCQAENVGESIYKNASHLWPLDYITGIKDVVTNTQATVFGTPGISLTGTGNAYMSFQLGKSAFQLGEYKDTCLTNLGRCRSGMTMSFWINCQELKNKINFKRLDLLTLTSDQNEVIVRISLLLDKDRYNFEMTMNDGTHQHKSTVTIKKQQWNHITMTYHHSGFNVYVNGIETSRSQSSSFRLKRGKRSTLMVGTLMALGSFQGPKVSFDEIAIWDGQLDATMIKNIVLKNYGKLELEKPCETNTTYLTVKWQTLMDPYQIIVGYDVISESAKGTIHIKRPANSTGATIRNLDPNMLYIVKVVARTISGFTFESSTIKCSTNLTNQKKEIGYQLISLSPTKIRLVWSSNSKDQRFSVGVSYSTAGKSAVFQLFVSKTFINQTFSKLDPDTEYEFIVFLYLTNRGIQQMTPKKIRTKRIVIMPTSGVRHLKVFYISWNHASIHWQPPINYTDPDVQYRISYRSLSTHRVIETTTPSARLDGLTEDTQYIVQVQVGAKGHGYLNQSARAIFRTPVRFPVPNRLMIKNLQWNSATITWQRVSRPDSVFYRISYHSEANKKPVVVSVGSSRTQLQLKGLQQGMGYFVSLKTGNGTVFSTAEVKDFFLTPDRNECEDSSNNCSVNSECLNTKGSFLCRCLPGFIEKDCKCIVNTGDWVTCSNASARNVEWQQTPSGQVAYTKCPAGTEGIAKRSCEVISKNKAKWLAPDLSNCVSTWMTDFTDKMRSGRDNSSTLMKNLANEYQTHSNLVGGDVESVVDVIGDLVQSQQPASGSKKTQSSQEIKSMAKNLLHITDNLLSPKTSASWEDLPKKKQTNTASGIMQVVEDIASVYSLSFENSTKAKNTLLITTSNTVLSVKKVLDADDLHFEDTSNAENKKSSSIALPSDILRGNNGAKSVYFGSFHNIGNLLGSETTKNKVEETETNSKVGSTIGSDVIAASLFPPEKKRFDKPVVVVHKLTNVNKSFTLTCVFWKFAKNDVGSWSADGCELKSRNETHAVCHCFHLTNFAVLMTVRKEPLKMSEHHERATFLITTVCICISLVALVIAFITFCCVKAIQSSRNTTHKHLVLALFLAQLIFLCGIDKTANEKICRGIAVATHYLFLVAFTLMGQEGFVLYKMLVKVYSRNGGYGNNKMLIACWVLPLIIVGVTLIIDYKAYGNQNYCWLNAEGGFIWSFVAPVISIIAVNVVFMVLAIRVMSVKSKKREVLTEEIWYWIKCCSMLVTTLGLCWILGIFNLSQESVAIVYVFSILNGLQGLAILIFLCVLDPRVKDVYRKNLCCFKKKKSFFVSRTMSSTKSTLPNRQSKFSEVNETTLLRNNSEKSKADRELKAVSMEYQEIVVDFSEDEAPCEL